MATPGDVLGHVAGSVSTYTSRMSQILNSTPAVLNPPAKDPTSPSLSPPSSLIGTTRTLSFTDPTGIIGPLKDSPTGTAGTSNLDSALQSQKQPQPTTVNIPNTPVKDDFDRENLSFLNSIPPNSHQNNPSQPDSHLKTPPRQLQQQSQQSQSLERVSYTKKLSQEFDEEEIVAILVQGTPNSVKEFADHLYTVATLISEKEVSPDTQKQLTDKLYELTDSLNMYNTTDFMDLQLHLIVERNFDIFVKLSTQKFDLEVSTVAVRFLTSLFMSLNYWQTYNLILWKPAVAHFLQVIQLDIHASYKDFIREYKRYNDQLEREETLASRDDSADSNSGEKSSSGMGRSARRSARNGGRSTRNATKNRKGLYLDNLSFYLEDLNSSDMDEDHDKFISDVMSGNSKVRKRSKNARNSYWLTAHKVIKKPGSSGNLFEPLLPVLASHLTKSSFSNDTLKPDHSLQISNSSDPKVYSPPPTYKILTKSSNYDPDVVHECQLPSADIVNELCLRRFLRKYELIRHQETVHSKKKKLFKCFVCVKQNPAIGPRIFTRHDTLAKHIRVNHKILGKEAKAEVAYLKKHAEVVEEGDITVHVGRRKTKVDFELRAHMDKRQGSRDNESDEEFEDYE